uniref:SSD domain-containing protein n=2 Tax=Phaeomonas parva TaxID=124430 RepID=A0A7S1U0H9_9STRA|mmetsp:Transcript_23967/g.75463  ORF Transcript_23967/g.75463 Transcript_23967/m.75463 type:complete len:881 (+) Transcript_23967:248-2890(+)
MNDAFTKLGLAVATNPWRTIVVAFVVFFLTVMGAVFNFQTESRGEKLWIPQNTQALDDQDVYESYFPSEARFNTVIFVAESGELLSPEGLAVLQEAFEFVEGITVEDDGQTLTFQDVCLEGNTGGYPCVITSVLENWGFNGTTLAADADPLATINAENTVSELERYLGGVSVAGDDVTAASAARLNVFLRSNSEVVDGDEIDEIGEAWEEEFLDYFIGRTLTGANGVRIECYPQATRSFSDEFGSAIQGDVALMTAGYFIILGYLAINLGEYTRVKMRLALSAGCLVAVGMSVGTSIGLSSAFGQFYGPVNTVLPFVLLGLGVDDAFVIVNSLDQTPPLPGERLEAPTRMARALGHSGVSISVTSLTDFVAFAISTSTVLPGLSTFCVYAAIGILALFGYVTTFFTACLVIDSRRQAATRMDCCCCIEAPLPSQDKAEVEYVRPVSRVSLFLRDYFAPFILKPGVREAIILGFLAMFGAFAHSATLLSVESSDRSFIPDGSYILDTFDQEDTYFAGRGTPVEVVTTDMDYYASQGVLLSLKERMSGRETRKPYIKDPSDEGSGYESWLEEFVAYLEVANPGALTTDADGYRVVATEADFYAELRTYLNAAGSQYNSSVAWQGSEEIAASRIGFEYVSFLEDDPRGGKRDDTAKQVRAMDGMRDLVASWDDVEGFAWSYSYLNWETFKIIYRELIQGTGLALLAVAIITLVLIAHPVASGLVFLCVAMTIVDILGVMFYWDLVVDSVSVIMLVLAVGLSVDYSAHVGHAFMTKQGTNEQRVIAALSDIGAAVLNGAISTFLAVVLLSQSDSYVFRVLFKQFFVTCVLGVGHGMIFLPVMLYFLGPKPYSNEGSTSPHVEMVRTEPDVAQNPGATAPKPTGA